MSEEKKYYCYCSSNCRYETMTKEQILAAIAQATGATNVDPDAGFISKVKETNSGQYVTFWVGTQAQYNEIATKATNCLYIITDDTTKADFEKAAANLVSICDRTAAIAAEAKSIASKAGFSREFNVHTASPTFAMLHTANASLFYIIEIASKEQPNVREAITVDYFSLVSGNYLRFPCGVTVYGKRDGTSVSIFVTDGWTDTYGLTRFTGYCNGYEGTQEEEEPKPEGNFASEAIAIAEEEVGYLEKASNSQLDNKTANAGDANYTKYARDIDAIDGFYNGAKQGYAWCEIFVAWVFVKAYGKQTAQSLLCLHDDCSGAGTEPHARYYRNKGQFYTSNPQVGDQIYFGTAAGKETHTGIVYAVDATKVYTIEGNTADPTGANAYRGVYRKEYALTNTNIVGYGRPKYDAE